MSIMIRASLIVQLIDGFTGKATGSGGVRVLLNGNPHTPVYKPEGYIIFVNMPAGEHEVQIIKPGFLPHTLRFISENTPKAQKIELYPGKGYPLPREALVISGIAKKGKALLKNTELYYGLKGRSLKLAQDTAAPGDESITLYGLTAGLPAALLFRGSAGAEAVRVVGEDGSLEAPLLYAHKRGDALLPIARFHTNEAGEYEAYLPSEGEYTFYLLEKGSVKECTLEPEAGAGRELIF